MPLRKEPFHPSEQVSQLLFGEKAEVLEVNDREWARIRCEWDNYEGWCKYSQLRMVQRKDYSKDTKFINVSHTDKLLMDNGELRLSLGSDLFGIKGKKVPVDKTNGIFKGKKMILENALFDAKSIQTAAQQYLHSPYQWGGRSAAGIDCSGFTQMVFKLCGEKLPRDAWQQAEQGTAVDFLQNAQCGDLAFFDNPEGKITHVGIILNNQKIIHATDSGGRVVIDVIDQGGIISNTLKKRTHSLRVIKRYIR
jgi:hypothetical protein